MGTQQTNDDGAMGLDLGPTNIDGEAVMPLVMTGPDSTRTLDRIVALGSTLEEDAGGWWRVRCGTVAWHNTPTAQWVRVGPGATGYIYVSKKQAIEEFANAPDPRDGRTPGPTTPCRTDAASFSTIIADEQRIADVFAECALAVEAMRGIQRNLYAPITLRDADWAACIGHAADRLESAIARANGGAA